MGAYAVNAQPFDLFLLLALGLLGFAMRRFGLPVLPLIVGVILGPLAEKQARRSLQLTGGDPSGLIGGPVAWACYAVIAVVLLWPLVAWALRRRRHDSDDRGGRDAGTRTEVSV
jgi:putative tricarboxylic transport membrane protein